MVNFQTLIVSFMLAGLFMVAMVGFGAGFATDHDLNNSITDNPAINRAFVNFSNEITGADSDASAQRQAFEEEVPQAGFGSLLLFSVIGAGKVFTGIVVGFYNITIGLAASLLGLPQALTATLTTLLMVAVIFLAWKLYRTGQ